VTVQWLETRRSVFNAASSTVFAQRRRGMEKDNCTMKVSACNTQVSAQRGIVNSVRAGTRSRGEEHLQDLSNRIGAPSRTAPLLTQTPPKEAVAVVLPPFLRASVRKLLQLQFRCSCSSVALQFRNCPTRPSPRPRAPARKLFPLPSRTERSTRNFTPHTALP
jgi:hypothetical protein